jgi:antitoxin ParD1/3/4
MSAITMNISLPDTMKEFIDTELDAGIYSSASDYVRALIRKDQVAKAEVTLREMILTGLNSGPAVAADAAFFKRVEERAIAAAKT